jgi:hypothetical protein
MIQFFGGIIAGTLIGAFFVLVLVSYTVLRVGNKL